MASRRKEGLIRVGIEYRTVAAESVTIRRPLVDLISIGIDCSFNPNSKLAGVHFMHIHRTRRIPTGDRATRTCQLPSAPRFERADTSGDETFVRQGALFGDPSNDEQWSDDLFDPSSHWTIAIVGKHKPGSEKG